MTVYDELTQAWVETFSFYVEEHPEHRYVEFAVAYEPDQCEAIRLALAERYPDRTFHVGEPSPSHLRARIAAGWLDGLDEAAQEQPQTQTKDMP